MNSSGISNPSIFSFLFFLDPEFEGFPKIRGSRLSNIFSFIFSKNPGFFLLRYFVIPSDGIFLENPRSTPFTSTPRSVSDIGKLFLY